MSGTVEFSRDAGCWIWTCQWGHYAIDHESEFEATQALLAHKCSMSF